MSLVHATVAPGTVSSVFLVDDTNAIIQGGVLCNNCKRVVGASVIDADDLKIAICLFSNAA